MVAIDADFFWDGGGRGLRGGRWGGGGCRGQSGE